LGDIYNLKAGDRTVFLLPLHIVCGMILHTSGDGVMRFVRRVISFLILYAVSYWDIFVKHSGTKKDGQRRLKFHLRPGYDKTERLRSKQIMDYTAADVKKLRDETGATFADCKNALTESKSWEEAVKS